MEALGFARRNVLRVLLASFVLLVPCLWQSRIQAGDLASHEYNAWLVHLIQQGKAPGLWLAHPWTNVLFDWLLTSLYRAFGAPVAAHIAVSIAVLVFFWGSFAAVATVNRRAPWTLAPCLAMLSYGLVFHAGFFNYSVSLGVSLFVLAIAWRGSSRDWIAILPLAALAWLAHPLPVVWILAAAAYVWLARRIRPRARFLLWLAGLAAVFAARELLITLFTTYRRPEQLLSMTGADQAAVGGGKDWLIALALLLFWCVLLLWRNSDRMRALSSIPAQLYGFAVAGVALLPDGILLSPTTDAWFSYLSWRTSLLAAVFACVLIGSVERRRWHAFGFSFIAAVFFWSVYAYERGLNRIEDRVMAAVSSLPRGQRVVLDLTGAKLSPSRVPWAAEHIIDRVCIGRCFSYANYEPSSGEFRVRASTGNPIVIANGWEAAAMERGTYVVKPADLPIFQIYSCRPGRMDLCIRPMRAGELNGSYSFGSPSIGLRPE